MAELETVARPYAKAVFMIAKESPKEAPQWDAFLNALKQSIQEDSFLALMKSPDFDYEQKKGFLAEVVSALLKRKITAKEGNFLSIICEHKRYALLPYIYDDFKRHLLSEQNIVKAEIQSAFALTDKQKTMFVDALKKRFNKDIELTVTISPSLLGGAILQIDDLVIDGSILGRLDNMIRSMN